MNRIEYQSEECIFKDVAYTPKLAEYPTLSEITELCEMRLNILIRG